MEPDFVDIVSLHYKINNASASKVQKMVHKFDAKMMKELLLIYFNFFFTSSNKTKYFNSNHSSSSLHLSIINLSTKTFKKTNLFKHSNSSTFNKLPRLLLSQCLSFLHQKDRAKFCRINLLFLKAASQSIAKYHVKITNKFIRQELIKKPNLVNYNNVGSLEIGRVTKRYGPRSRFLQNYNANLLKITSNPLTSYSAHYDSSAHYSCGYGYNIIDKNEIKYVDNVIKTVKEWPRTRIKDIFNESNLLHLDLVAPSLTFLNDLSEYHPIYWLWNLPTLQSCKISLTLPIAKPFESQCNRLLSQLNVINKAKKQKDFKTLDISVHFEDSSWDHMYIGVPAHEQKTRETKDNKYCSIDYVTFLKYIFKLYPHLTSFKCNENTPDRSISYGYVRLDCMEMDGFDLTNISFKSLQHINLSLFTINNATHLLSKLKSHTCNQLQTLKIKIIADVDTSTTNKLEILNQYGGYEPWYYMNEAINDFVDDICQFLENHMHRKNINLHYLGIDLDVKWGCYEVIHKCLRKTYWNPYNKYLQFILNMIDNGNIFDGCLELMIPSGIPIAYNEPYDSLIGYLQFPLSLKERYKWNKINIQGSLKVAQLLSKMQTSIHQHNELLKDTTCCEKKLVMRMPKLHVYPPHKKFLKFWFNDTNLCNKDCAKFVMY